LKDPVARKNFRLVVIVPDSVEQTDLSDPEKARRFRYTFDESAKANAGWKTEELWPYKRRVLVFTSTQKLTIKHDSAIECSKQYHTVP
jgi:hypothetical protein